MDRWLAAGECLPRGIQRSMWSGWAEVGKSGCQERPIKGSSAEDISWCEPFSQPYGCTPLSSGRGRL